eukprot:162822_1
MALEIIGLVEAWIIYPISIAVMLYIMKMNFDHKKDYEAANKVLNDNKFYRWLMIFSLAVMVSLTAQMTFYLSHKIPYVCLATYILQTPFYTLSGVLITYYQIARLQYCFSASQTYNQYGIHQGVFIFLYVFGAILPLSTLVLTYYGQSVTTAGYFGCHWVFQPIFNGVVVPIILLYYICYDFLVLGIYICKIHQIRRKQNFNDTVSLRINYILDKIKILTIIYEIKSIGVIVSAMMIGFDLYVLTIALPIINCIDVIYSFITIYLMQEHNENAYMKLIAFVSNHKIICCVCCCKRAINDAIEYTKDGGTDDKQKKTNDIFKKQIDLSANTTDNTIEMQHDTYEHGSEMTVDIASKNEK